MSQTDGTSARAPGASRRWIMVVPAAMALTLGVLLSCLLQYELGTQQASTPTPGKVLASEIRTDHTAPGVGYTTFYYAMFRVQYDADGQAFVFEDRGSRNSREGDETDQKDLLNEHPVGSDVTVYYNPHRPADAALKARTPPAALAMTHIPWIVGAAVAAILLVATSLPRSADAHSANAAMQVGPAGARPDVAAGAGVRDSTNGGAGRAGAAVPLTPAGEGD